MRTWTARRVPCGAATAPRSGPGPREARRPGPAPAASPRGRSPSWRCASFPPAAEGRRARRRRGRRYDTLAPRHRPGLYSTRPAPGRTSHVTTNPLPPSDALEVERPSRPNVGLPPVAPLIRVETPAWGAGAKVLFRWLCAYFVL